MVTSMIPSVDNAFKNQVKAINDNAALTDAEKVIAINVLLNPVPLIPVNALLLNGVPLTNNNEYITIGA